MKENTLITICFLITVIGLFLIYFSNKIIEPKLTEIKDLSINENFVKLNCEVDEIYESKTGTIFLKVSDKTGVIDVVVFKNSIENIHDVNVDDSIEIIGKPELYKGKVEVIASKIQPVKSDFV